MSSLWKGVFSRLLFLGGRSAKFWVFQYGYGLSVFRQSERYHINLAYRAPAVAPSDLVEGIRVPRGPPYLIVLNF